MGTHKNRIKDWWDSANKHTRIGVGVAAAILLVALLSNCS